MNKRIYIGFIREYWTEDERYFNKEEFKILFDKTEILKYCVSVTQENTNNNIPKIDYDCDIIILEYASERYQFENPVSFINYFENLIKSNTDNLYDKLLKCIDCNFYHYSIDGTLLDSHVCPMELKEGYLHFSVDDPLLEEECKDGYNSNFKYFYNSPNQDHNLIEEYEVINEIYFCNIFIDSDPYSEYDSGIDYITLFFNKYDMSIILAEAKNELLIRASKYIDYDESITDDVLEDIINTKFKNYIIDVYKINDSSYSKIFSANNISKLREGI